MLSFRSAAALAALLISGACSGDPNPAKAVTEMPRINMREMSDSLTQRMQQETGTALQVSLVRISGKSVENAAAALTVSAAGMTQGWSIPDAGNKIVLLVAPDQGMFRLEYGPDAPMRSILYFERTVLPAFVSWMEGVACYSDAPSPRVSGMTCTQTRAAPEKK